MQLKLEVAADEVLALKVQVCRELVQLNRDLLVSTKIAVLEPLLGTLEARWTRIATARHESATKTFPFRRTLNVTHAATAALSAESFCYQ